MGAPVAVQWEQIRLGTMRLWVRSLALLRGVRIQRCRELWCRLQMRLGSGIAVAVAWASSCSSDSAPSWELPYAAGAAPKSKKKKKERKKNKETISVNTRNLHVPTFLYSSRLLGCLQFLLQPLGAFPLPHWVMTSLPVSLRK